MAASAVAPRKPAGSSHLRFVEEVVDVVFIVLPIVASGAELRNKWGLQKRVTLETPIWCPKNLHFQLDFLPEAQSSNILRVRHGLYFVPAAFDAQPIGAG